MKHHFCIFFVIGLLNTGFSQISIISSDMPQPGYSEYISTPDTLISVDPAPTGANFSWDFSNMNPILQQKDSFLNINSLPFTYSLFFSGASVVQFIPTPDSLNGIALDAAYNFFDASSSQYESMGFGAEISGTPIPARSDPADIIYRFPLIYGQEDSSESVTQLAIPNLIFFRQEQKRVNIVDGWGTLKTPYGTFDVLRIASTLTVYDSVVFDTIDIAFNQPTQVEYKWLGKEARIPLLQINSLKVDSIGEVVNSIQYVDSARTFNTVGISDLKEAKSLKIIPNPATTQFSVEMVEYLGPNAVMEIMDAKGAIVQQINFDQPEMQISVNHLPKGIYLVRIQSEKGTFNGKLLLR